MKNNLDIKQFYTVKEAAQFLEVTAQTVSKYLREGSMQGEKKGPKKKWFISGAEVLKKRKEYYKRSQKRKES